MKMFKNSLEKIKLFGLNHCDMPTIIWNFSVLLRPITINIDPRYQEKIPIFFYIGTTSMYSCYLYVYVFSVLWFVTMGRSDIVTSTIIFTLGGASAIGSMKFAYMLFYQKKLRNLLAKYLECDSNVIPESRYSKNILKCLRPVKRRAIFFWISIISNGIGYVAKPLLTPGRHLQEDIEFLYGLSPILESPYYEIAHILTLGGVAFVVYATATITACLITITGYIEAQMHSLCEELKEIWNDAEIFYEEREQAQNDLEHVYQKLNNNKAKIMNEFVKEKLQYIIKMHASNIYFQQQIEEVFRNSIAIEFLLLLINSILELIVGLENTYLEIPFLLVQVIMDCVTGQKLIDSSIIFEEGVYDSKWENYDLSNMKTVMMILLNSQKKMALSVGGYTNLSYVCLMSVFRIIYSAYTTLRSTVN